MLTLSQAFSDAFSAAEVEPVLLVELWTDTTDPQMYCTGGRAVELSSYTNLAGGTVSETIKAAPSVGHVSPLATGLDPFDRTIERNHLTATFHDDGGLRDFIVANRVVGQTVVVRLGIRSMASGGDWAQVFRGTIDKVKPREGQIDLTCADSFSYLNRPYRGNWVNKHPLQAMNKILDDCGIPSALIDSASFDPANHTDISQYVVNYWPRPIAAGSASSGGVISNLGGSSRSNTPAHDPFGRLRELARGMVGTVFAQESGVLKFLRFDPDATVRANWSADDIRDFEQLDTETINEVEVTTTTNFMKEGQGESVAVFARDATSQTNHAGPGESVRVFSRSVEFDIDDFQCRLVFDISGPGGGLFFTQRPWGMPGTRVQSGYITGAWGQDSDAALSASRPAYLMIEDEVMKATALTLSADEIAYDKEYNAHGRPGDSVTVPAIALWTVAESGRGQMDTTAVAHSAKEERLSVHDVTMAHDFAAVQLQRFSNGCPSVSVTTSLKEWAVQVGDLVTLDGIDVFLAHTFDGIGTSVKWEVTSKELRLDDSAAEILWTLVYATETSPPVNDLTFDWAEPKAGQAGATLAAGHCYFVVKDLGVTAVSGMVVQVDQGTAGLGATGEATHLHSAKSLTMLSNKDCYIDYNVDGGTVGVIAVANGAQEPNLYANSVRLAKVVTGGSAVTSITDLRRFGQTTPDSISAGDFEAGANLIHNSNFQSWACGGGFPPDLWEMTYSGEVWGTDTLRDSVNFASDRYSVKLTKRYSDFGIKSKRFRVEGGRVYMLGASIRAADSAQVVRVALAQYDVAGVHAAIAYGVNKSGFGSTFAQSNGAITTHDNATHAEVWLYSWTSDTDVWIDSLRMVRAWPNFHAEANAADSHASLSVLGVDFSSVKHDVGGNFASHGFTAPHDGFYKFTANVQTTAASTPVVDLYGGSYSSVIRLNRYRDSTTTTIAEGMASDNVGRWTFSISTGSVELLAGDRVALNLLNGTDQILNINYSSGQTWIMGEQTS